MVVGEGREWISVVVGEGMKECRRVEERLESRRSGSKKTYRQKMVRRGIGYMVTTIRFQHAEG